MRVFSGTVLGYLLFELLWRAIFQVTNTDPHAPASISFEVGAVIFGLLFALLSGYIAALVGGRPHYVAAWVAAVLVALTAIVVMARDVVAWPQMTKLFLMSPAVVAGGWYCVMQRRNKTGSGSDQA